MYMEEGIKRAKETSLRGDGGPFGAVVVLDGKIVSVASNTVLLQHDPTAHAEINAIREAARKLGTHNLKNCVLYATGYPCPMCLSAIMWANIHEVYYGTDLEDAGKIGFRDDFIYDFIRSGNRGDVLHLKQINHAECLKLMKDYQKNEKEIY